MLYFIIFIFFLFLVVYLVHEEFDYQKSFDSRKNAYNDEGDSK